MFDIGFPELMLLAVVGLLVIGPERLPETLRTLGLWFGRMRRSFTAVKTEIEKEIGMDEVRRQLHNEAIMEEMRRIEEDVKNTAHNVQAETEQSIQPPPSATKNEPESAEPLPEPKAAGTSDTPSSNGNTADSSKA